MPKQSAGLLMYRHRESKLELFLVHPGGPFWAKKDLGAWSIPKGEYAAGENPLDAARREFTEETGFTAKGDFLDLGTIKQAGGKLVSAWAVEGDCDPTALRSNLCPIEWPPRSGRQIEIPEVDRAAWFSLDEARQRILKSQTPVIDLLIKRLGGRECVTIRHAGRPDGRCRASVSEPGRGKSELRRAVCRITSGIAASRPRDG
jgi:predicted NUDIX family NTP pyrophosphohydrolase